MAKVRVGGETASRSKRWISNWTTAVALLMVMVLATACSSADGSDGNEGSDDGAATGESVDGGEGSGGNGESLNVIYGNDPPTLDPAQIEPGGDLFLTQSYEFLVAYPPEGAEPVPWLATEVPSEENGLVSEDGMTWTFPIRESVKFHDGTDLSADDVKFSWDRVMTMDLPEGQGGKLTDIIESTRVVDDYTFEVTLNRPAAWFLSVVNSIPAAIVSQDAVEANGGVEAGQPNEFMSENIVGTGPYRLASWERNVALNFEAFDDYWGEPKPSLDARLVINDDLASTVLALNAGDIDVVDPNPAYLDQINQEVCAEEEGFLLEPIIAAFNLNIPEGGLPPDDTIPLDFFHDPRVRQAFNYAFDYETYVQRGLNGAGEPPESYLPAALAGADPSVPSYEQDLERAEELFRESGWWDEGFRISVMVEGGNPTYEVAGLLLKDALEGMNPNFRVNVLGYSEAQFDETFAQTPFPFAMWIKNADAFSDPHFVMREYFDPTGHWGEILGYAKGYEDPEAISELVQQASTETDFDERVGIYTDLQERIFENPMWIWIAEEKNIQIHRCSLEGFEYNPLWLMPKWQYITAK